jgi:hypothetical protein
MDYSQIPLREMQMPDAIGWWPLAPGWWLLLLFVVCGIAALFFYIRKKLKDPKRFALREFKIIVERYHSSQDKAALLMECNSLLKRLAITLYPRKKVAHLSGHEWLAFLAGSSAVSMAELPEIIQAGPYQQNVDFDANELMLFCKRWLKAVKGEADV